MADDIKREFGEKVVETLDIDRREAYQVYMGLAQMTFDIGDACDKKGYILVDIDFDSEKVKYLNKNGKRAVTSIRRLIPFD